MEELKERILREGEVIGNNIIKVDRFLNHQIDPVFMQAIGRQFAAQFADQKITKVITIESSGIAPAVMTGLALEVPVIFIRKKKPTTSKGEVFVAEVYSYTKKETNAIYIEKELLTNQDRVLIIDDFLANGEASLGLAKLVEMSGALVAGVGIVVEKSFQNGRHRLDHAGYRVHALARIASLEGGEVRFLD
ncbi:xanthine phosphoribosyltransferase [Sporolactobacillus spathodeae]|uniref:Xanthine phosphoribosyltransferase n=1 Tax=Sporolactobacillus spathodeae TaxID=1465502 RepID=A0ABS2Q839_9BACL|nr:xanthine phosphoribosyltransferase [Sporolactobacillus spathodeae]MBM7657953.1 xanthine phosphoribosyltransferase [Sporolactobacillus spathodeae]